MRIPGALSGVPMNSMPAASRADCSLTSVATRASGKPEKVSILLIVLSETSQISARSDPDQPKALLAARI